MTVYDQNRIIRESITDTTQHTKASITYQYNTNGLFTGTLIRYPDRTENTEVIYNTGWTYTLKLNGMSLSSTQDAEWRKKYDYLTPKRKTNIDGEDRLPYSDPVPEMIYTHTLEHDKKGNITADHITAGATWMQKVDMTYLYEYQYWK